MKMLIIALALLAFLASTASAYCIDFESLPDGTAITDKLLISDQYNCAPYWVSFSLAGADSSVGPKIAKVGPPKTAFGGPSVYSACSLEYSGSDKPAIGEDVGCFFLTDDEALSPNPFTLVVTYTYPVQGAEGDLLDIDGTEAWTVTAYDDVNSPIAGATATFNAADGGDGEATHWSLSSPNTDIKYIKLAYTGAVCNVGLAFDNFCPNVVAPPDSTNEHQVGWIPNNTGKTAYDLTHIFKHHIEIAGAILYAPFTDFEVTHTTESGFDYTYLHWEGGSVAPAESAMGCFTTASNEVELLSTRWTDASGAYIGDAVPGYTFRKQARDTVNIWHLDIAIHNSWVDWTATAYPPAPGDVPGPPMGPITVSDYRWALTDHKRPFEELNADLYTDPTLSWQSLPGFTLSYGDSASQELSEPGGLDGSDIVIVGFNISGGDLSCPQFVQIPFGALMPDVTSVPDEQTHGDVHGAARLIGAVPNPFNPSTTIQFELAREAEAELRVYSVTGRLVTTLARGMRPAGVHEVTWRGRDDAGARVASGVYMCRLKSGELQDSIKIVLLK